MAKSAPAADTGEVEAQITLNEFCTQLSQSDKRVELIGGFNATETQAGRIKDTFAGFSERFTAFVNKPV